VVTNITISGKLSNPESSTWETIIGLIQNAFFKLDFGRFPRHQIAGKWQPGEGFMAGAWEAESFHDVYLATRPHLISGRYLLTLA
jgi:hypothetical protein